MEITSKFMDKETSFPPGTYPTSCTTTTTTTNNNNPSPTIPITRSDPNSPYPTTFVTADTSSFKQVVQMLTGSSETTPPSPKTHHHHHHQQHDLTTTTTSSSKNFVIPPIKTAPKKQGFKLYERRNSIKNLISPLNSSSSSYHHQNASFSPRHKQEILSPSLLDFPSLTLSPVTPLVEDPFIKSSPSILINHNHNNGGGFSSPSSSSFEEEEEKAIADKGFYLHPSPVSTPRDSQPQLLPLFPLSSPRLSDP